MTSLYDLIDVDEIMTESKNDETYKIEETQNEINKSKSVYEIKWFDSIEYLKYSHTYLHDKLIIATSKYKEKNRNIYDLFRQMGLIRSSEKYVLEYYIKKNYKLVNLLIEHNTKKLQNKNSLSDPKKFFIKKKIHNPIKMSINITDQTVKGTLYDKALSYVYDENIDFLTVVRSCKSIKEIDDLITKNRILDSSDIIGVLFGSQLEEIKEIINNEFTNMTPCKIIYSHETQTYGYPDFIANDWIIDIKTSKTSILNMKNYLQVISYAICSDVNNVCLYDIENGCIYKGNIKQDIIDKIKFVLFS